MDARRLYGLALVLVLHVALAAILVLAMRQTRATSKEQRPVEVALVKQIVLPPPPPPPALPHNERITAPIIAAPQIEIAPDVTAAQGPQALATGTGGGGNVRGEAPVRAAIPPDPGCEPLQAYIARVRDFIVARMDYDREAQGRNMGGIITLHFISAQDGKLLAARITGSTVTRIFAVPRLEGGMTQLTVRFTPDGEGQWRYSASAPPARGGAAVPVADGVVRQQDDGHLAPPDDPQAQKLSLTLPRAVTGTGPQAAVLALETGAVMTLLDRAVLDTVKKVAPLPPIPACMHLRNLNVEMPFTFGITLEPRLVRSRRR